MVVVTAKSHDGVPVQKRYTKNNKNKKRQKTWTEIRDSTKAAVAAAAAAAAATAKPIAASIVTETPHQR